MQHKHYNILSYSLTMVGYMTLTLSMPLLSFIANDLNISYDHAQAGIGTLFFTFSLSAILLSSLSDMLGTFVVLKYAQLLSITGLWILCFSKNELSFLLGCFCVGSGTGCYASNARAIISRHAIHQEHMKKAFSTMSILIIAAPIVSFYLAITMSGLNWRLAYAAMAIIEMLLLVYALWVLSHEDVSYRHKKLANLILGFTYCLKQKLFSLNMIFLGVALAIFMQLFMANIHQLLIDNQGVSVTNFEILLLFMSVIYIIGILLFRKFGLQLSNFSVRISVMSLLILGALIFNISNTLNATMIGIYIICGTLGFAVPFTTSSGMSVIKQHHGSAAALFTFSFACISAVWSIIQTHLSITIKNFMSFGLWISAAILLLTCISLSLIKSQEEIKPVVEVGAE